MKDAQLIKRSMTAETVLALYASENAIPNRPPTEYTCAAFCAGPHGAIALIDPAYPPMQDDRHAVALVVYDAHQERMVYVHFYSADQKDEAITDVDVLARVAGMPASEVPALARITG